MTELDRSKIEVMSSKRQLENFKKSFIWKDIVNELSVWQEGFGIEMANIVDDAEGNNPSTASVLLHMGDLNGRIKAVQYILNLPDLFLHILEERKDVSRSKRTD